MMSSPAGETKGKQGAPVDGHHEARFQQAGGAGRRFGVHMTRSECVSPAPYGKKGEIKIRQVDRHFIEDVRVTGEVDPVRPFDEKADRLALASKWPSATIVLGGNCGYSDWPDSS